MTQLVPIERIKCRLDQEAENLRRQIGSSNGRGGRRYRPYVFTEHGVAMLSRVLKSERRGSPDRFGPQIYLGGEAAGSSASLPARTKHLDERRDDSVDLQKVTLMVDSIDPLNLRPRPPRYFRIAQRFGFKPKE
jgi:hypothetical protein